MTTVKNNKFMALYNAAYRFYILYGGRSSGKSWEAVEYLLKRALQKKTRILCCREFQGSIRESVHKLLVDTIYRLGVSAYFRVTYNTITCVNGSEFIFAGLYNNVDAIKSTEGVDICHVEEAHNVSQTSWDILIPTIRKAGSEFLIVYNPREMDGATHQMMLNPYPNTYSAELNYTDNPYNSAEIIELAEHCKATDPDAYEHIWLGKPLQFTNQQILANKLSVTEFDPADWDLGVRSTRQFSTYYGLDFGYSQDPTAGIRVHIKDNCLWIDGEFGSTGIEIDDIGHEIRKAFPELGRSRIWADCSLPATISHVKKKGGVTGVKGATKWAGSVEDGIMHLRSYDRIVVHPRCVNVIREMNKYMWKLNAQQEITSKPEDKNNHWMDALRYALVEVIQSARTRNDNPWGI